MTTFIDLYILDDVLFYPDMEAGIIAHRLPDATKIFRRKIKYPYDNLPDEIKERKPLITQRNDELAFPNNSVVYVSTSIRSGTAQRLHISEFGKICAKFPEKADEIVAGSLNAIHPGSILWIESTAEGKDGQFYEYCQEAQKLIHEGIKPNKLEFKLFFFGWTSDKDKVLDQEVVLNQKHFKYFNKIESHLGIKLTDQQKWWWAATEKTQRHLMKKEHPATVDEAFEAAIEGAYYVEELATARAEGRIGKFPHIPGITVDTWWDIGFRDPTSIWFTQTVGKQINVIDYYENNLTGLAHYGKILYDKSVEYGYHYGTHTGPHDTMKHEFGVGKTIAEQAKSLISPIDGKNYSFMFSVANRINSDQEGREAVRNIFPYLFFNEPMTTIAVKIGGKEKLVGLPSLENFRAEWDEKKEDFRDNYVHNYASHASKAMETLAITHQFKSRISDYLDDILV